MGLQRIIDWLLPREDHFYETLSRQADLALRAARTLTTFRSGIAAAEIRSSVEATEAEGDKLVRSLLAALGRTFVTPIDREDLQRLSKKLDDILDYIDLGARACVLYGVDQPTRPMLDLVDQIERGCTAIVAAMPHIKAHRYQQAIEAVAPMEDLGKRGDLVFRDAMSHLFHDADIDAKTILREKEVLEDLAKAIKCCLQVSETIVNIAVKHG